MAAVLNLRKFSSGGCSYSNRADHLILCRNNILPEGSGRKLQSQIRWPPKTHLLT
ncbi:hypothetical protein BDR03DRAFT_946215 [Suillus americanus]|nr:hypothetical protein BDR03DRAFT_946215 [Suillus americanus]